VCLPDHKRLKFLAKLDTWLEGAMISRSETQSLLGSLNHCCAVILASRTHLPSLYRFLSCFPTERPLVRHNIPRAVLDDINWWREVLNSDWVGRKIGNVPPSDNLLIHVDASTSWGIGAVIGNHWLAWPLKSGWKSDG
jgi:hypothetical protein